MSENLTTTGLAPTDPGPDGPTLADRLRGAMWGQFVGDAFCLGSHWIYNLSEMEKSYPGGLRGFELPLEGHYHAGKHPGDQTHYGDGALTMLESVADLGHFDPRDFGRRFTDKFGAPDHASYLDKATRGTLENLETFREAFPGQPYDYQNGADDDQLATASRLAPVVAAHFRDPDLLEVVARATRVAQNNERVIVYVQADALVLRELFEGRDLHTALHRAEENVVAADPARGLEVRRKVFQAMGESLRPVLETTLKFGQSCPMASSFPSAIHCSVKHEHSFADAIQENARAGGDNAGRAGMIGGWLGALRGVGGIPRAWIERLTARERINVSVEKLVAHVIGADGPGDEASQEQQSKP